ncbi:hypothetical protein [Bdellovibrio bacteriovorus]|uniref:Uncharacterized protein n=1 Tax=Bdellovibrio bacteriovorus TaxID=959 RepID=A0A1Z3N4Z5_BDEBC|nr:hypothetical protein [Bdellovibrio bacteriovorus]ASD62544.1 hypothetical protein B9G79_02645 [Bdellovibrio bacteriovorus]
MTMNPLPPQAYTKETMLKAYQWLMVQNSSIKEMATTPDILVSLYLKATRDGEHSLERPSIQNFKNELKSLAGMMGELDRAPQASSVVVQAAAAAAVQAQPMMAPQQPVHQVQHVPQMQQQVLPPVQPVMTMPPAPATQTQVSYTEKTLTTTSRAPETLDMLDCGSKAMIQEVKDEFNLSSDLEALRMLIKIGYSRSKGLLK